MPVLPMSLAVLFLKCAASNRSLPAQHQDHRTRLTMAFSNSLTFAAFLSILLLVGTTYLIASQERFQQNGQSVSAGHVNTDDLIPFKESRRCEYICIV